MLPIFGLSIALFVSSFGARSSSPIFVQQQFNSISGYVSDGHRNPLSDLQVELLNDADSVVQRTKTDSSGRYGFRIPTSGVFQIRVLTSGTTFIGQTQRVQLERGRAFEQVDFALVNRQPPSVAGTPGVVFVQKVPADARKLYEHGTELLKKEQQRTDGIADLENAIKIFPEYFDALQSLGGEYVVLQRYEKAIPVLTKAVEVNRDAYPSLYALSIAQYNLKLLPEAIDSMRRAIVLEPKSVNANLWLGMLLRQTGALSESEPYLKQADQLATAKSSEVHWQLALLFNQLQRYKEAADELELFLKIEPDAKDTELIKRLIKQFRDKSAASEKP
ncbi:MAG TPA: tetratricopeptide repeat protein [Pyrinomonadaceae bacterium]|jgi:tetratricopeptide (TPR) repeat protein|nr:tetratricopeptide repeat protein [Pyrinomonadaceae bacterium]